MSAEPIELSVGQARDHFSAAVNRAYFAGQITYITRGRGRHRAAAIVPTELIEDYEALLDREDGRIAEQRLTDLEAGRISPVSAEEAERMLGL